ncbi:glycosyltransferase family 4 protein [Rouxiella sp. S1S-2]|uniref:glycosyltransferase family 4 protein n=1 Tax=Rouxiella sp. S1S-2 TaxID=2653856 RepID=UPI001D00FE34|nr:glycosyltransferase family 4 protein [Rouxiella sp. S1S-2]
MNNVVMFTRSLPMHGLGGMEVVAWDIAKGLRDEGCNIKVVTTCTAEFTGQHTIDGIDIYFIENIKIGKYSAKWWRESKRIFDQYFAHHCDTVFSVSSGAYGIINHRRAYPGTQFLIQVHGTAWGEFVSKIKTRTLRGFLTSPKNLMWLCRDLLTYNQFDYIVGIGQQVCADFKKWPYSRIIKLDKTRLISNGIDVELFKDSCENTEKIKNKYHIPVNKKVILTACRLHPQKGVYNCIQALNLLKNKQDFVYLIAGDGSDEARLKALVQTLNAQDYIKFIGAKTRDELAEIASVSDIFLFLTDRIEGLPLNILEAAAVGLPIVLAEQVQLFPSSNIHLINPRDYATAAAKIASLLSELPREKVSYIPAEYTLSYAANKYKRLLTLE